MFARISTGQVILAEDFVLAIRDGCDGENQPGFVRIVLLDHVDTGRYLQSFQVSEQLLDENLFTRWSHAYSEHYLRLVHREDLVLLDEQELLFGDILTIFLGEELATSGQQLPECGYALKSSQFGGGTSINH